MSRLRAVILCPGRGTYQRTALGSLAGLEQAEPVQVFDQVRAALGRPSVVHLDRLDGFRPSQHVAGELASGLTAAVSLADLSRLDPERVEVVGVCGNSMGWYTALAVAGALPLAHAAELIETLGGYQARDQVGVVGGQVVVPWCDEQWRPSPALVAQVSAAVEAVPGLYLSIRLGGQAVLGGTDEALAAARALLPELERGAHRYPLRLPLHSAFHTPLMQPTAARAARELAHLGWTRPTVPLIDGRGAVWSPHATDPAALADYTLGHQVVAPFDFTAMVRVAVGELAPDVVVLPGPGSNLTGAVAQVLIEAGWRGLAHKEDFLTRQARTDEPPVLLSLRWPDQAAWAVASA